MSDTNFRPGSTTGYGAGSGSGSASSIGAGTGSRTGAQDDLSAQHPRGSGMSYEAQRRRQGSHSESYMDQASDMADEAWRGAQDYYEQGSRRVSEWANEHPNQLWAAIAIAGAFALWMAYRPIFSSVSRSNFDPSRYRYRRLPRPSGRAEFMERRTASATSRTGWED